jgi:hypothetical protein
VSGCFITNRLLHFSSALSPRRLIKYSRAPGNLPADFFPLPRRNSASRRTYTRWLMHFYATRIPERARYATTAPRHSSLVFYKRPRRKHFQILSKRQIHINPTHFRFSRRKIFLGYDQIIILSLGVDNDNE